MPGLAISVMEDSLREGPQWLPALLKGEYFSSCQQHAASTRSEKNFFCTNCGGGSLCGMCVQKSHSGHQTIQVRRSSYHEAVRVSDVQRLLDISGVQIYVINSAKIVFLNERPQKSHQKGAPFPCQTCHRSLLQESCRFCCLECKLRAIPVDSTASFHLRSSLSGLNSLSASHGVQFMPSLPEAPLPFPSLPSTSPPVISFPATHPSTPRSAAPSPAESPVSGGTAEEGSADSNVNDDIYEAKNGLKGGVHGAKIFRRKRTMPALVLDEDDSGDSSESLAVKETVSQLNEQVVFHGGERRTVGELFPPLKKSRYHRPAGLVENSNDCSHKQQPIWTGKNSALLQAAETAAVSLMTMTSAVPEPSTPPSKVMAPQAQWRGGGHLTKIKSKPHRAAWW
eukprot:TRINITY_DN29436_c0_g1_i1.p1 TRINITY_DN29436_c0_g1~~TRINITY_DN29436_c0_g1_i1.p1  ORF type:complete len:396 (-),score=44.83 TRINITY_DN29436_c0_g1_i1:1476-2663(-)